MLALIWVAVGCTGVMTLMRAAELGWSELAVCLDVYSTYVLN